MSNETKKLASAYISYYSGYRHNRYDGFNCSRGVLSALGASSTADCFADADDYPDDDFYKKWNGYDELCQVGNVDFQKSILSNLDLSKSDIEDIKNLENGETYNHSEFWGEEIKITFYRDHDNIICDFDSVATYVCEF